MGRCENGTVIYIYNTSLAIFVNGKYITLIQKQRKCIKKRLQKYDTHEGYGNKFTAREKQFLKEDDNIQQEQKWKQKQKQQNHANSVYFAERKKEK